VTTFLQLSEPSDQGIVIRLAAEGFVLAVEVTEDDARAISLEKEDGLPECATAERVPEHPLVQAAVDYAAALVEAAVPFKSYPKDETSAWSFSGADGNALLQPGGTNWARYKAAHTWVDGSGTPESKGAYKLPHHKLKAGTMTTFWTGVKAAAGAMAGARGASPVPQAERKPVLRHLQRHYREFGKPFPPDLAKEIEGDARTNIVLAARRFAEEKERFRGQP